MSQNGLHYPLFRLAEADRCRFHYGKGEWVASHFTVPGWLDTTQPVIAQIELAPEVVSSGKVSWALNMAHIQPGKKLSNDEQDAFIERKPHKAKEPTADTYALEWSIDASKWNEHDLIAFRFQRTELMDGWEASHRLIRFEILGSPKHEATPLAFSVTTKIQSDGEP